MYASNLRMPYLNENDPTHGGPLTFVSFKAWEPSPLSRRNILSLNVGQKKRSFRL